MLPRFRRVSRTGSNFFRRVRLFGNQLSMLTSWLVVSISPPTIPHMEHPTAYKDQKEYLVRFLEPHEVTSQRWPGSPNPASSSSPSVASSHGLSSPSGYPTPDTVASSCSIRSGFSLGPPILSIDSYQIKDEMRYPRYRFQNEHGERPGVMFSDGRFSNA